MFKWHWPPNSMDGKGRALNNIFVERLWRTVKYEPGRRADIYLKTYADGWQLEAGLQAYFEFYNHQRFHQGLAYQTPEQVIKGAKSSTNQVSKTITNNFVIQQSGPVSGTQYTTGFNSGK